MAGKKYREAKAMVDRMVALPIAEAVALAKKTSVTKFDSSVEISFNLNVDPRQADQNIRGAMPLPFGTGKTRKVLVITQGAKVEEAQNAGADFVGGADMIEKIQGGWLDFDIIVATPDMMGQLGKLGRLLGPRGLMPNPKTGTVTMNVASAVDQIKKGQIEYRVDREGNLNTLIGKVSFSDEALIGNFNAVKDQLIRVRPASVKGAYIKGITIATTMGPGIKVAVE
ncbi:MAG: 50S ribosomal protein L1 [Solobacterium sp.]|nr:50S ribosomal protein L1 [Erysipelotrichaceae bacterium]MBQ1326185.1 50S ribosomal protein L1 [Solobacterium sp.]MBQ1383180.1 50S ribosomal protein L1 [Solobacterium sp.]MBQ1445946.1 50S ribosomal protein L1 [Solobacterium sp.]